MTELLPCPFCGGAGSVIYDGGNEVWHQSWRAGCTLCGIQFKVSGSNSWSTGNPENRAIDKAAEAKAIAAWNQRRYRLQDFPLAAESDHSDPPPLF